MEENNEEANSPKGTDGVGVSESANDANALPPPSRRITRTANSRRMVRRKSQKSLLENSPDCSANSSRDTSPIHSSPLQVSPASVDEDSPNGSINRLSRPPSSSSIHSDDGINDSITNMGELTTSLTGMFGRAAASTWGWMKTAVNQGMTLWYGDAGGIPEEWHCDSASEAEDDDDMGEGAAGGLEDQEDNSEAAKALRDRTYFICNELCTTEEAYVQRLGILVMVKERAMKIVQPDVAKTMFQNVDVIHQFHKDYLLPQLQERINSWEKDRRIGDIMKKLVPFLKLYTEYVKNFEKASQLVDSTEQKSSSFAALLKEVKTKPEYGRLRIQAHMLEPVQRVPRYELLLRDYLKRLPQNSVDRPDTEKAMELVSETASHFENMMKRDSQIMELMQIQNEISGPVNIVGPKRKFIKRGKIMKVSANTGKTSEKYAFLFTDMMLLCAEQSLPGLSSGHYKVRHIFELESAQVTSGNNLALPNTFYIKSTKHAVELATKSTSERDEWVEAIEAQMSKCTKDKLMRHGSRRGIDKTKRSSTFGLVAPVHVRMNDVSMCMLCAANFSAIKRKQHCAACGNVICGKCSGKQMKLDYDASRSQRVCDNCFVIATDGATSTKKMAKGKTVGNCLERGYLQLTSDSGKSWKPCYLSIYDSRMLYSFKAPQDINPLTSVALHGSKCCTETLKFHQKDCKVLQIKVSGKKYHLYDDNEELLLRWQRTLAEMESSPRDSMVSMDSLNLDSQSIDTQSVDSQSLASDFEYNNHGDGTSHISVDSGVASEGKGN